MLIDTHAAEDEDFCLYHSQIHDVSLILYSWMYLFTYLPIYLFAYSPIDLQQRISSCPYGICKT